MADRDVYILGRNCKAYYGSSLLDGSSVLPSSDIWTELTNLKDVKVDKSAAEVDITTRASGDYDATAPGTKMLTATFQMQQRDNDAGYTAIETAHENGTEIALMFLNGANDSAGVKGEAGNFTVTGFNENQDLKGAVTVDVTVKHSSQGQTYTVE